ncbi:PilZ domain-containing protein [Altererythrobacter aquiaggeris]|uniref:PilZ domain-containing protein n=1 Tax=Aestuarierythrobacter aquiaggeris TaxID=1898396 RepID=UPI003019F518
MNTLCIMDGEDDLYFIVRKGEIWACWLSGKPAVKLANAAEFASAVSQFSDETAPLDAAHPARPEVDDTEPAPSNTATIYKERIEARYNLTVLGRIFTVGGSSDVTIFDLSEKGCRFQDASWKLVLGHQITIKIGSIGPLDATVKWRRDNTVGVQFITPLYPSILKHIRESFDLRRK